jgi:hypothetical protein
MPFKSQAQRGLFYKAKSDPAFAKQKGLPKSVINDFVNADPGGKLPKKAKKKRASSSGGGTPYYPLPIRR